jgi:hypothetical protein
MMALFVSAFLLPSSIYSQTNLGETIFLGTGLTLSSAGNWLSFPNPTPNSYRKCFSNTNTVKAEPKMPTGLSIYVQEAKRVRIRYDLITEDGVTVRTEEYESFNYEWPTYVTGTNINNIGNEIFSHTPFDGRDYYFKITVRAGKKIGFFMPLNWSTVLGTYYTLPAEVKYKQANPQFSLTSQIGTDAGGRPISCASDVRINGSASTCETVYYLEVTETDQWWNHSFPPADFAGKWFTGTVPSNIDLQWFCNNFGNPLNGDPVMGINPTAYAGFSMETDNYPDTPFPNFYRIKLVTFQNAWKEKNMLIDVDGSCKTGSPSIAFDPTSMVPMTQTELDELFQRHGNPLVDEALQAENSLEPSVKIYPNPAKDYCTITATEVILIENIQITDLYGNTFECPANERVDNSIEINTSDLNSGLYIIVVQIGDKLIREKLWIR